MSLLSTIFIPDLSTTYTVASLDPRGINISRVQRQVLSREGLNGYGLRERGRKAEPGVISCILTANSLLTMQQQVEDFRDSVEGQSIEITHHTGFEYLNLHCFKIELLRAQASPIILGGVSPFHAAFAMVRLSLLHTS